MRKIYILSLILLLFSFSLLVSYPFIAGPLVREKTLIIAPGSSGQAIASLLAKEGVIRWRHAFTLMKLARGTGGNLQAGEYRFPAEIIPLEAIRKLEQGDVVIHPVTLAEGLTSREMLTHLQTTGLFSGAWPQDAAEGGLFPDTYHIRRGHDAGGLLSHMQARMEEALQEAWQRRDAKRVMLASPRELLIMASLIEKETGKPEERALVASVFYNRLAKNMRLQTDPTVRYAVALEGEALAGPLRKEHLRRESPYNTYLNKGLPPSPICNPGKASLEAAARPAETDFLYFVADGLGGHRFAKTLKEHNANVREYRAKNSGE